MDVAIDALGVFVEGVETLNHAGDESDQADDYEDVDADECEMYGSVPSDVRMMGSEDPLGEEEVHDEEEDDSCCDENVGGDGQADVCDVAGPDDAQYHRRYS